MAVTSLGICARTSSASLSLLSSLPRSPLRVSCYSPQLSPSPIDKTLTQIQNSGVIACLRANSAEQALKAARAALSGGISVLEIVMSTPGVFEVVLELYIFNFSNWLRQSVYVLLFSFAQVLQQLVQENPNPALGIHTWMEFLEFLLNSPSILQVGTVLNVEDAKNAINSGAKFLMSPATVKDIMVDVKCAEVLYIPGVMTPTEILSAYDTGAKIVKVYPVSALGGSQYISALKRPFHHISMVASQGITIDSIREYISRGATAVVLSDAIFNKEAIIQNDFEEIYQLANFAALQGIEAVERKKKCMLN
ncbi:KHG/KDPG aldolase-like isoform X2 [Carya illinoinensis]|uniref:KHG/KDPG aldolase-like isoform X2 n=1 Tax=Carya illinoinensis TaxID=32201 RepID=UPI001C721A5A|nr:KHG/KDPG aldolase-like isoform X2 [Carya illinoinensis]